MKYLIIIALIGIGILPAFTQPVVKADALVFLSELPTPPSNLADAYLRAYPKSATQADAKTFYQTNIDKLVHAQQEAQQLLMQFYRQNPSGVLVMPQKTSNNVSAKDKAAMDAATSELAQKMLTDKAFAQKFAQMSPSEQEAYMAKMLADKGLKPVNGTPNTNDKTIAGTDVDWVTPCNELMQTTIAMDRWNKQIALQEKYDTQHDAVNQWAETAINQLPMISLGEYGHDHDPEQVKTIQKQGLDKHRQIADAAMQESAILFDEFRQQARMRYIPLNDALKKVQYGTAYNFGVNYTLVLQAQMMMFGDIHTVLDNEIKFIEAIARWEYDWRSLQ